MKTFTIVLLALMSAMACGHGPSTITAPSETGGQSVPAPPQPTGTGATYRATLTASPRCAGTLPEMARERTYTATLTSGGSIDWNGPTLHPPSGHATISTGALSETSFTFSIDVPRDPQDDAFNGLWDDLAGAGVLTISGNGAGTVEGSRITGSLDGTFAFVGDAVGTRAYCIATDHRFTFISE